MIVAFTAVFISLIYLGGGLSITHPFYGLALGGTSAVILGTLFAYLQMLKASALFDFTFHPDGLELGHLRDMPVSDETLVFIMGPDKLVPAADTFQCLIDGKRVLVVEPMSEYVPETVEELF
jgi:hypothetical protein